MRNKELLWTALGWGERGERIPHNLASHATPLYIVVSTVSLIEPPRQKLRELIIQYGHSLAGGEHPEVVADAPVGAADARVQPSLLSASRSLASPIGLVRVFTERRPLNSASTRASLA